MCFSVCRFEADALTLTLEFKSVRVWCNKRRFKHVGHWSTPVLYLIFFFNVTKVIILRMKRFWLVVLIQDCAVHIQLIKVNLLLKCGCLFYVFPFFVCQKLWLSAYTQNHETRVSQKPSLWPEFSEKKVLVTLNCDFVWMKHLNPLTPSPRKKE